MTQRRKLDIRPETVGRVRSHQAEAKRGTHIRDMVAPATPLPGVLPAGVTKALAMDASPLTGMAMDTALAQFASAYPVAAWSVGMAWLGYPVLSEMSQRPEYRGMVETIAKAMTRRWITIRSIDADLNENRIARINRIEEVMKAHSVRQKFRHLSELDGFFGRGQLYIDLGTREDAAELQTPLVMDKAKVRLGSLNYLKVVEPIWTYPGEYNSVDPLAMDFYRPRSWYVMGKELHASRLLTVISREVPDLLKPAYAFGGLSLSQMAKPYVDNWLRTRQSVSDLIASFSVPVLKTNMQAILEDGGDAGSLLQRAALFTALRDNQGLMSLDKETEEFAFITTPLGGLDALQAQSQEQMASVSHIPLVVLLGITPSGLNATSDGEIRVFYDWIRAMQEHIFTGPLDTIMNVIQLSEFGEIDPGIGYEFNPLWEPTQREVADTQKIQADTDAVYVSAGVLGPDEVRRRVADDPSLPYSDIDPDVMPPPSPEELAAEAMVGREPFYAG